MKNHQHIIRYLRKGVEAGLGELELLAQLEEMNVPVEVIEKIVY